MKWIKAFVLILLVLRADRMLGELGIGLSTAILLILICYWLANMKEETE